MPSLDDLCWAVITFRERFNKYDLSYFAVLGNNAFMENLRYYQQDLDVNDVSNILVKFLNKWGCRLRNYDNITASNLKNCIVDVYHELLAVQNHSILIFDFEDAENRERIKNIFDRFRRNFGPTPISKTLHIINPDLFTMWDNKIKESYGFCNGSGRGYVQFSIVIKGIAQGLTDECTERFNINDPALWLSERLNIDPPKSLVKFIDEFNWLAYTDKLARPPDWTCPF